jgi:hypothetical protein
MMTLFNMFVPQANEISPLFVGVNSMSTDSFSGNARLTLRDGTTTSVAQVLSVVRVNVRRAGAPARKVTFAGSDPARRR